MAAMLACSTAHALCNSPVAQTRTSGELFTSSNCRLHLREQLVKKLSFKLIGKQSIVPMMRASNSDSIRELASEKAVESSKQVAEDANRLANGQSPVVLDAKAEDASDTASYTPDVREKVVDVASDMSVDTTADVDELARKDAEPLAEEFGYTVEDTANALENKAEEVGEREVKKESA
ncbi:uncharacterized protein [Physcomitrium patens]|uniref:Uncharacterized protein n=1 Tax=Physcomitrium patens TaxID=3218 RepID=A9RWJ6_PHYPA|nr:uncharacterized protein LOC112287449 [Physcomitrium patens]PNR47091.1 hypothetical protein PHYPA_014211 [Physcomitrium patens]|eukprot:XP_024386201.1 uncharacterized protein LOC112287449 [Physcomitrella patens]